MVDPPPNDNAHGVGGALFYLQNHWKILVLGQGLSLLLASGGASQATLHLQCGLSAPTFNVSLIYFFLSFHLIVVYKRQQPKHNHTALVLEDNVAAAAEEWEEEDTSMEDNNDDNNDSAKKHSFLGLTLHRPVWQYFLIAFFDVQANAITMLAFRYTTLTSVSLFDSLAIPSALTVSKLFYRRNRRYTRTHLLGVLVCMMGIGLNVTQDSSSSDDTIMEQEYPHKLRGDVLAITGGVLYGLNDVVSEIMIKQNQDTVEYLGMLGFSAFWISFVQAMILEWQDILEFFGRTSTTGASSTCSLAMGWWLLVVFVAVNVIGYSLGTNFLFVSEAAFFNLSLLTGDLYAVFFSIVAERIVPRPLFFLALLFVLSGVVIYEMSPSPIVRNNEDMILVLENDDDDENDDENHFELQENSSIT